MAIIEIVCPTGYADNSEIRMTIIEIECRLSWADAAVWYWLKECRNLIASWSDR